MRNLANNHCWDYSEQGKSAEKKAPKKWALEFTKELFVRLNYLLGCGVIRR